MCRNHLLCRRDLTPIPTSQPAHNTHFPVVWEISPPEVQQDAELPERRAKSIPLVSPHLNPQAAWLTRIWEEISRKDKQNPKIPEQELLLPDQRVCSGGNAPTVCFNKTESNYFGLNQNQVSGL